MTARDNIDEGILSVTFCIKYRGSGGTVALLKQLRKLSGKTSNLHEAVRNALETSLKKHAPNKKFNCIYDVVYGGGEIGNTTMITLSYSVNLPTKAIIPIQENRMAIKQENRQIKYTAMVKLQNMRGWKVGRKSIKYKKQKRLILPAEMKRVKDAVSRWEPKWYALSDEKKKNIADNYNVSLRSFASYVACRHGKHADRRK